MVSRLYFCSFGIISYDGDGLFRHLGKSSIAPRYYGSAKNGFRPANLSLCTKPHFWRQEVKMEKLSSFCASFN